MTEQVYRAAAQPHRTDPHGGAQNNARVQGGDYNTVDVCYRPTAEFSLDVEDIVERVL